MKSLLILSMIIASCGEVYLDKRTRSHPEPDKWKVIGTININMKFMEEPGGYLASQSTNVTYTVAEANDFTINTGNISVSETSESVLDFGSIDISQLKVNKLKQCGVSNDQKCTSAIIRAYTTEVSGHPGIGGFVNKTDGDGIPVKAGENTASSTVGLNVANAVTLDSYTIPASDKKLTASDFSGVVYEVEADFSNAGAGDYEMNLVIELAVAL